MSKDEKKEFLKAVTILIDTREQVNSHIVDALDALGVMHESRKLDFGDYSFKVGEKNFSVACVVERKANIDELYGNVTTDRDRIEKELETIARNARQCTLLLEDCSGWEHLKGYEIPETQADKQGRKVRNIGATVYASLQSWKCGNRYDFDVVFSPNKSQSALKMIEIFFWYYHNFKQQTAPRKSK